MQKKFIQLSQVEKITLQEGMKKGKSRLFRERCHCLLLSADDYGVKDLAEVFRVSQITIYGWLKRWEKRGVVGLRDLPGRGRKAILKSADLPQIKLRVQQNAQQLKLARAKLKEDLARDFSEKTLRRYLKNLVADIKDGGGV